MNQTEIAAAVEEGVELGSPVRVIVTGGRNFQDQDVVFAALDLLHRLTPIKELSQGGCWCNPVDDKWQKTYGVDYFAWLWAKERGVRSRTYHADWENYGRSAGPRRNSTMVNDGADIVLAFPGGRGTKGCVELARAAGLFVLVFNVPRERVGAN